MHKFEAIFWTVGVTLILIFFGAHAWSEIENQRGVAAFESQRDVAVFGDVQQSVSVPDWVLAGLSHAYIEDAATATLPRQLSGETVLAILRISGIGLEVPVRYGTDERVLRRGAGVVEGTAVPGANGNVAIAAHRDIHFRGLKDLEVGDVIELEMLDRTQSYIVTDLSVVEPTDVHVLDETGEPVLTLVTCYPFYFVGNAPQRFIVRAEAAEFFH